MAKNQILFVLILLTIQITAADSYARVRVLVKPWWPNAVLITPPPPKTPPPPSRYTGPPDKVRIAPGYLDLQIRPSDTEVFIDGVYRGDAGSLKNTATYIPLAPGPHSIALEKEGFIPKKFEVKTRSGEVIELDVTMKILSAEPTATVEKSYNLDLEKKGSVLFKVEPQDASVYIDDTFYGPLSQFDDENSTILLSEGKHNIVITRPGYVDYESTIEVVGDTLKEIHLNLEKK